MQMRIIVLGTKEVKFEDKDKNAVEGVKVHYGVEGGKLSEGTKGFAPVSAFMKGSRREVKQEEWNQFAESEKSTI